MRPQAWATRDPNTLAHDLRRSMAQGTPVAAKLYGGEEVEGRVVRMTRDKTVKIVWQQGNGSNLTVHFEDARAVPLDRIETVAL